MGYRTSLTTWLNRFRWDPKLSQCILLRTSSNEKSQSSQSWSSINKRLRMMDSTLWTETMINARSMSRRQPPTPPSLPSAETGKGREILTRSMATRRAGMEGLNTKIEERIPTRFTRHLKHTPKLTTRWRAQRSRDPSLAALRLTRTWSTSRAWANLSSVSSSLIWIKFQKKMSPRSMWTKSSESMRRHK